VGHRRTLLDAIAVLRVDAKAPRFRQSTHLLRTLPNAAKLR
jgi:hypothetical protein